jgi:glycosyltransferase involved in cell wall biosynthesis
MEKIIVSILCHTFNHASFIKQALDGFIMQKTDFDFEICIHDDASTDTTKQIIEQYEKLYPTLVKPIYQSTNQYSQGKSVFEINRQRAKGKYLAICEGDDFWIDPFKLQKQVDILEMDDKCVCVGHACYIQNTRNPFARKVWKIGTEERILTMEEIIKHRGSVFPFHSFMFRNEPILMPEFFKHFKVGDVTRLMYFSLIGNIIYMPDVMSVYRVGVDLSWTHRVRMNTQKLILHYQSEYEFFKEFNQYTNYQYDTLINNTIDYLEFLILSRKREFQKLEHDKFKPFTKRNRYSQFAYWFEKNFPNVFDSLRVLRFKYWV